MLSADLKDSVAAELGYAVPEVQAVFAKLNENRVLHVWTIVPQYDRCIYKSVYAREKEIIKKFDGLAFDFNVVPSNGRDPRSLITDPDIDLAFLRK